MLTKTNFVLGLVSLDCQLRVIENFFCHLLNETVLSFFFLLLNPVQYLDKTFLYLILFAQSRKIFSKF